MKNKINEIMASVTIFIFLSGIALAQPFGLQKASFKKNYGVLSGPNGRFVFGQISESSKDQYMLDTWTGRLWRMTENSQVGKFLTPIPYKRKDGKYSELPEKCHKKKK